MVKSKTKKKKRKLSAYNLHMKREMKKGRTFKQAVASWKGKGTVKRSSKPKTKKKRSKRSMPKKKKRRGTNPITKLLMRARGWFKHILRFGALIAPAGASIMAHGFSQNALADVSQKYMGVDVTTGAVAPIRLVEGWGPALMTNIILKIANALGA